MSNIKKFAGQTAIYGVSTIIARLLNFILTPIYVKLYAANVYGIFTYLYSWASMLNAILSMGMETTFFRYQAKYENNKEKVYNNTFIAIVGISLLFLLFTVFFVGDIAAWMQQGKNFNPDYARYVKLFIYILVVDALAVIPFAKVRAEGKSMRYAMIKFINIFTFVGLNLFFIYIIPLIIKSGGYGSQFLASTYTPQWVGYVFISNLIASIITLILLLPEILKLKLQIDVKLLKEMFIYSLPVLVANMSFIINENSDKILLGNLLPANIATQEVGIYGACCKIAIFLSIFIQAFRLGAEPFFFSQAKNKNSAETYARIMNYFVIGVCLIFIILVANIEILKYFISGSPTEKAVYWSGLGVVPILLFGYVSLGIYMNLSIWYKLSDQTRYGLYISVVGALITFILNIIFIPKYSYIASAWISLIAYLIMMILSYLLGQKKYPIPYNLKKNLGYLISSVTVVFISFILFKRNLVIGNLLVFLFVMITLYIERKELKLIFGNKKPISP